MTFLSVIRMGGYNAANIFTTITVCYIASLIIAIANQKLLKVLLLRMLLKGNTLVKILLMEKNYNVML